MNNKTYFLVTGVFFTVIAFLQLTRLVLGWEAVVDGWRVPFWLSGVFVLVAGYLAYISFRLKEGVL